MLTIFCTSCKFVWHQTQINICECLHPTECSECFIIYECQAEHCTLILFGPLEYRSMIRIGFSAKRIYVTNCTMFFFSTCRTFSTITTNVENMQHIRTTCLVIAFDFEIFPGRSLRVGLFKIDNANFR